MVSRSWFGHLDADGAFAGHALDEDAFGAHGEAEVVGEAGDAGVLHAGFGLELEGGDHGAGIDALNWPRTSNSAHFSTRTRASSRSSSSRTTCGPAPELSKVLGGQLEAADILGRDGDGAFLGIGAVVNGDAGARGTVPDWRGSRSRDCRSCRACFRHCAHGMEPVARAATAAGAGATATGPVCGVTGVEAATGVAESATVRSQMLVATGGEWGHHSSDLEPSLGTAGRRQP